MAPLRRFGSTDTRQDLTPITPNLIAWLHRRSQNRARLADITPSKRHRASCIGGRHGSLQPKESRPGEARPHAGRSASSAPSMPIRQQRQDD